MWDLNKFIQTAYKRKSLWTKKKEFVLTLCTNLCKQSVQICTNLSKDICLIKFFWVIDFIYRHWGSNVNLDWDSRKSVHIYAKSSWEKNSDYLSSLTNQFISMSRWRFSCASTSTSVSTVTVNTQHDTSRTWVQWFFNFEETTTRMRSNTNRFIYMKSTIHLSQITMKSTIKRVSHKSRKRCVYEAKILR